MVLTNLIANIPKNNLYFQRSYRELLYYYYKALEVLDLPLIDLEVDCYFYSATSKGYFDSADKSILVNLYAEEVKLENYNLRPGMTNQELSIYVLFHELGHYWHYVKHNTHWNKFVGSYKDIWSCEEKEYRFQHFERIADKVAKILFNNLVRQVY